MNEKKINFLVIHDYEIPTLLNLKNLSENRFDICLRCILSCCSYYLDQRIPEISFLFFNNNLESRMKYITWNKLISDEEDEVSLAGEISASYNTIVKEDYLENIIKRETYDLIIHLEEKGNSFKQNQEKIKISSNILFVLGAKNDIPRHLIDIIKPHLLLNISPESMLASHVIILIRELLFISKIW